MSRLTTVALLSTALLSTCLVGCHVPFTSACPGGSDGWTMRNPPTPAPSTAHTNAGKLVLALSLPGMATPGNEINGVAYNFALEGGDASQCRVWVSAESGDRRQEFTARPGGTVDMLGYRWIVTYVRYKNPAAATFVRSEAVPAGDPTASDTATAP